MEAEKKALQKIKPSKEEEQRVGDFTASLVKEARQVSGLECTVCGSMGKGTWIRSHHDIDLFIVFDKTASREELEKNGLEFGKKISQKMKGRHIIKYAEHPYVRAFISGFIVDIVPCYRIEHGEHIKSAVDRSPLHVKYVKENLPEKAKDEVRLLKKFCQGIGVYGSDAKNMGFSGYICELLVLNYGSFQKVLKAAKRWVVPALIDFGLKQNIVFKKEYPDQPFIIIDPTDPKRNAAANVSAENFSMFIYNATVYLKKPKIEFFFPKQKKPLSRPEIRQLKKRETYFIALKMKRPDMIDDNLYPQLRRALARINKLIEFNEFYIIRSYEWADKKDAVLMFETEIQRLPITKKMKGPVIFSRKHSEEFLEKYKKEKFSVYLEGVNWSAERKRQYLTPPALLKSFTRQKEEDLKQKGMPQDLIKPVKKAVLLDQNKFWSYVLKNRHLSAFLRQKYFERIV